jgi:hypothetical protein
MSFHFVVGCEIDIIVVAAGSMLGCVIPAPE